MFLWKVRPLPFFKKRVITTNFLVECYDFFLIPVKINFYTCKCLWNKVDDFLEVFLLILYPMEKAMAPHSSTLAWKIPWTEEPGRLQSMGSRRVGHDWATSLSLFTFMHWRRKWQPTPCSCLENPRDGGAWWAAIYGVAQSRTWLKRLSSSSSSSIGERHEGFSGFSKPVSQGGKCIKN